jgi:hypothetical protein
MFYYEQIYLTTITESTWHKRASADFAGATPEQSDVRTALSKPTVLKKLPSCKFRLQLKFLAQFDNKYQSIIKSLLGNFLSRKQTS